MAYQRVGVCSLCGGTVRGFRGGWGSVDPPPPDQCQQCDAVAAEAVMTMAKPSLLKPLPQEDELSLAVKLKIMKLEREVKQRANNPCDRA